MIRTGNGGSWLNWGKLYSLFLLALFFHKWLKEKANISLRKDKNQSGKKKERKNKYENEKDRKKADREVGRKNPRNVESIFSNETFSQLECIYDGANL